MQPLEQFLAGDFRRQLPHRRVRHLIGRVEPGAERHALGEPRLEIVTTVAGHRRNHEGRLEFGLLIGDLGQRQKLVARHQIDLVEDQDFARLHLGEPRQQLLRLFVHAFARVDHDADQIGFVRAAPGGRHHGAVEAALGREDARRIDEDNLRLAIDGDATDERARRLHLVRDDGDLGADERVQQRRLAGIGSADQRNKAAAGVGSHRCLQIGGIFIGHQFYPVSRRRWLTWPARRPARRRAWTPHCLRPAAGQAARPPL